MRARIQEGRNKSLNVRAGSSGQPIPFANYQKWAYIGRVGKQQTPFGNDHKRMSRWIAAGLIACAAAAASAQMGSMDAPVKAKTYVVYAAEAQTVTAAKPTVVAIRFHVADGYHVNSHTPKSELLIPTALKFDPADGVKAEALEYPAGKTYSFSFDPGEKLDVYAGDFTVKLPVIATAGDHTLHGTLRYQACDNAACYPPKTLVVQVPFTAK